MIRKTLTILSLIGLLLSVGLWGVSCFSLVYAPRSLIHQFRLDAGAIHFHRITGQNPDDWRKVALQMIEVNGEPAQHGGGSITSDSAPVADFEFFGPGFAVHGFQSFETLWLPRCSSSPSGSMQYLSIRIPLWIPTVLFTLILWFSSVPFRRRRKRKKLGLCLKCGYDLRGSKERCPECGEAFEK